MRILEITITLFILYSFGCGSDGNQQDADPFDTFQACYDEHHVMEGFGAQHTITICCLDHPIGNAKPNTVCGESQAPCEAYVATNVSPSPTASDVTQACMDYILQRSM